MQAQSNIISLQEAVVIKGQRAWAFIKKSAADQRQAWREVGQALAYGRALHKSDRAFSSWIKEQGFDDIPSSTRSDAMWLAQHWFTVTVDLDPSVYHPKNIRQGHRDIRNMLADLDDSVLKDVLETKDSRGYTASFSLPKDLTLTLVSGYSAPMRHKIVCRWLELEAQTQVPAKPLTYREAMMLAVDNHEQLEAAKEQLAIAAPKVQVYDTIVSVFHQRWTDGQPWRPSQHPFGEEAGLTQG